MTTIKICPRLWKYYISSRYSHEDISHQEIFTIKIFPKTHRSWELVGCFALYPFWSKNQPGNSSHGSWSVRGCGNISSRYSHQFPIKSFPHTHRSFLRFGWLFCALPILRQKLAGQSVRRILICPRLRKYLVKILSSRHFPSRSSHRHIAFSWYLVSDFCALSVLEQNRMGNSSDRGGIFLPEPVIRQYGWPADEKKM